MRPRYSSTSSLPVRSGSLSAVICSGLTPSAWATSARVSRRILAEAKQAVSAAGG
jgi:hypothetical protein